jgi:hypothetical protein
MKQLRAVFLVLFLCAPLVHLQKSASQPTSQAGLDATAAELVVLTDAWTDAINANGRAKLETLMAPEFAAYGWNGGQLATRWLWLNNVHSFSENALQRNLPGGKNSECIARGKGTSSTRAVKPSKNGPAL